jgi:histidyl-tRNA synthetase
MTVSKRAETIRSVKGMRDLLPPDTSLWQRVEEEAHRILAAYNYSEIRTPILELTELFARSVGADTDIVTKEMYTFQDRPKGRELEESSRRQAERVREREGGAAPRLPLGQEEEIPGGDLLTLRPEATASVVRAYIEHGLFNQGGVHKLYYIGPMFRRERPQKGRYRQFYQIGAEVLGSDHPALDAEVLEMLALFLERVGIKEYSLLLNSVGCPKCRPAFVEHLRKALGAVEAKLCADCQRRTESNPLRVLDCKVEADQPIIARLPCILDHLCPACRQHFDAVTADLLRRGLAYQITPRLVRGLDYYTRTTFEITSLALGAQNALVGGGRYDGLSEMIGGPPTPGFGFSIGQDRLMAVLEQAAPIRRGRLLAAYIAWLGEAALAPASQLARELRREGLCVELDYEPMKLKKSLGLANKLQARFAIIIGEGELASGRYQVKDMTTGVQQELEPGLIASYLKGKL